jgi:glycine dehydrogenase subunit 1
LVISFDGYIRTGVIHPFVSPGDTCAESLIFWTEIMPYLSHSDDDRKALMDAIGVASVEELLTSIPDNLRLHEPLNLPSPISEVELRREFAEMAAANRTDLVNFMGGGASEHYIPSALDALASRSEFVTAYTPYQAEVSQGTLQVIYEFQSMICELTGMDAANASLYDGGSALAEAAFLAAAATRKSKIVVSKSVNPRYRQVLATTVRGSDLRIEEVGIDDGVTDLDQLRQAVDDDTAAVMTAHPNFLGFLEPVEEIVEICHAKKALASVSVDPVSLSLLQPPGDYGVDIVTGEGQPLGIPLSFGGPYLGFFAVRKPLVRRMPGRLAGATTDTKGRKGYVLTMQTREQHIRRDKATSNICTNQALCALRATIYLALLGKEGFRMIGELCLQKSHYLADRLKEIPGVSLVSSQPFFREFAIQTPKPGKAVVTLLKDKGFLIGPVLDDLDVGVEQGLLVSVTELRTKQEMDDLARA